MTSGPRPTIEVMAKTPTSFNGEVPPTIESLARRVDTSEAMKEWRDDRMVRGLGKMAAATIEYRSLHIEDPELFFQDVAEAVERTPDGVNILLREPVGEHGFRALTASFDDSLDTRHHRVTPVHTGFVAENFQVDAPRLLQRGGWPSWNRTGYVGMYDRRVTARQFGTAVVRPGRLYLRQLVPRDEQLIYAATPQIFSDSGVQSAFTDSVQDNMRERGSQDEVDYQTEGIAMVYPADGGMLRSSELLFAHDYAKAVEALNREEGFAEHRSIGQFNTLMEWIATSETGSREFANYVRESMPYKTGADALWDQQRYSKPQPALVAPAVWPTLEAVVKGSLKIDGFGAKAARALAIMMAQYEEAKSNQLVRVEALEEQHAPIVEVLDFYDREDAKELGALLKVLSESNSGEPVSKERISMMIDNPDRAQLVVRLDDRIVGTASLSMTAGIGAGKRAYLHDFVASPEVRGKGIGSQLWDAAIEWARQQGAASLDFTSGPAYADAHAFYRAKGAESRTTTPFRYVIPAKSESDL